MKTKIFFAAMLAMVCMFITMPASAQKMSKAEKAAGYDKAKADAKKAINDLKAAKNAAKEKAEADAEKIASLQAQLEDMKNAQQPAPTTMTTSDQQQPTPTTADQPRDQNKPTVELNFTMADLMRNPDSIARVMTAAVKAQKKVQQAQQEYNDLLAGKIPVKPKNQWGYLKNHPIINLKDSTAICLKSDSTQVAEMGFKVTKTHPR